MNPFYSMHLKREKSINSLSDNRKKEQAKKAIVSKSKPKKRSKVLAGDAPNKSVVASFSEGQFKKYVEGTSLSSNKWREEQKEKKIKPLHAEKIFSAQKGFDMRSKSYHSLKDDLLEVDLARGIYERRQTNSAPLRSKRTASGKDKIYSKSMTPTAKVKSTSDFGRPNRKNRKKMRPIVGEM